MKVLIIGLGSIAQKHVFVLKKLYSDVQILALRSSSNSTSVEGIHNVLTLADVQDDIDFIIISNPTIKHFETIQNVLYLNRPLFIEKPSLHSLEFAFPLLESIKQKKILTYVACNLRFHPCLQFVKNYLENSSYKINEVNIYCGSYLPYWRTNVDFRNVYSANKEMGGGVHLDLIHELDYIYYLFGSPVTSQKILKSKSDLNISSIDYAHYVLDYEYFTAAVTLNYFRKASKRQLEIVFSHAILILDFINYQILIDDKVVFEVEKDILVTYLAQMKYFTDCIRNQKEPFNSLKESIEVLKICLNEPIG